MQNVQHKRASAKAREPRDGHAERGRKRGSDGTGGARGAGKVPRR